MSSTREGQIAENVAHKLDEIAGSAHQLYDRGRERVDELRDSMDGYIKARPMRSILIAAGVGLCLGLILARR